MVVVALLLLITAEAVVVERLPLDKTEPLEPTQRVAMVEREQRLLFRVLQ